MRTKWNAIEGRVTLALIVEGLYYKISIGMIDLNIIVLFKVVPNIMDKNYVAHILFRMNVRVFV